VKKIFNAYTQILTTYDQLENDLLGMKKILSGDIHIATVYSIGLHELPPYIKLFLSEFPEVNLKVEYRRSNLVYDDVEQNLVDIGLVAFKTDNKNLEFIPFKDDRLILVCSPKHPLARKGEIDIKELDSENFIAYEPDIPTRKASDDLFKKHKISVNTIKEYDNTETVKNSVEINAGVALLPETSVQQELRQRSLIKINMTGIEITRPLFIVHKKGKVLSPARLKFIDLLTTKLDD
jgi:DNA-binding transcriptional LysR family regulator